MTRFLTLTIACILSPLVVSPARAAYTIRVAPSVAPNLFNSAAYPGYRDNAVAALLAGNTTAGTPGDPSYYEATSAISVTDMIVTDFSSWRGTAAPGGAFAGEFGNRLHFGLVVTRGTSDAQFSISQLSFTATADVPSVAAVLNFSIPAGGPPDGYDYNDDYIGYVYDSNGVLTRVTALDATTPVDVLVGRGSGNAFEVLSTDPGTSDQDRINRVVAGIPSFTYTGRYTLTNNGTVLASGEQTVTVSAVPAPPSAVLLLTAAVGLAGRGVRRRLGLRTV